MNIPINEPFEAWANLLFSLDDRPGSYEEARHQLRQPVSVWFDIEPPKHRTAVSTLHILTPAFWRWKGLQGYILFGVWLAPVGGEPFFTWTGRDDYYMPFQVFKGSDVTLSPA